MAGQGRARNGRQGAARHGRAGHGKAGEDWRGAARRNGGTVVIGGIFELNESENETKVPVLGDLPAVGNLFKSRQRASTKQEMLVFITPKMISDRAAAR